MASKEVVVAVGEVMVVGVAPVIPLAAVVVEDTEDMGLAFNTMPGAAEVTAATAA